MERDTILLASAVLMAPVLRTLTSASEITPVNWAQVRADCIDEAFLLADEIHRRVSAAEAAKEEARKAAIMAEDIPF